MGCDYPYLMNCRIDLPPVRLPISSSAPAPVTVTMTVPLPVPAKRGGVFAKILLWYVGTVLIVILITAGMMAYLQSDAEKDHLQFAWENLREEAEEFVGEYEANHPSPKGKTRVGPSRIWVFDDAGLVLAHPKAPFSEVTVVSGHPGPIDHPALEDSKNGGRAGKSHRQRRVPPMWGGWRPRPPADVDLAVPARAMIAGSEENRIFEVGEDDFLGCRLNGPSGRVYAAFTWNRPRTYRMLLFILGRPSVWLRLWVLMSVVIVLCWWLARYLVRPVLEVQKLVGHIADGDYQQRLPESLTGRYDELGNLAADMNRVTSTVEAVIKGQQQLLRDVSHELRSPLARIRVSLELLRSKDPAGNSSGVLNKIERDVERLNELIQQVLDLSRLDQVQSIPLPRETLNLSEFLGEISSMVQFEASPWRKTIRYRTEGDPVMVCASEEHLQRALENVLRNAVRYAPEDSEITVDLGWVSDPQGAGRLVRIVVADQGPGVPPEHVERVFDPFFRCEEDRGRSSGGTGLGLAIVRKAIDAHQGRVKARNLEPHGLEVEILLPPDRPTTTG